ncbi:choice-of-anchor Q domain-containing protein [Dyadobacter aurulentus]|uniref:choice-of-anchor Q domain-containing protein n=1 Tax=Dyadobacter sp. UC 10 TaxID=2605428 RepID=UPI0011F2739D|nr:choice-of-anchor Q domain-containing protein [Dyadobacter sp. UC 10]KAA0990914.1 T9SS type A sorting domain-containing protein [Dyadobacter sp. UC 10]
MRLLFLLTLLLFSKHNAHAIIRYVKPGGSGTQTGASWANASADLQLMINESSDTEVDEIYVAEGTYIPNRPATDLSTINPTNRNNAFTFTKNVRVFGGFPATGDPAFSDRAPGTYKTILSGNIGDAGNRNDNAYHVVITAGTNITQAFVMDGFTISDGVLHFSTPGFYLNDSYIFGPNGAGWHNNRASPTFRNIIITNNTAQSGSFGYGLGFYNDFGNPALLNVVISNNGGSSSVGGGGYTRSGHPVLTNVVVHGNVANSGSAWYNQNSNTTFNNVTIAGNSATDQGAIYVYGGNLTFNNSIVAYNEAVRKPGIYTNNVFPSTLNINYSLVQGEAGGSVDNLDGTVDPKFVNPVSAGAVPTASGDYRLKATSPCINIGNDALLPSGVSTDLDGRQRITAGGVDMGAYEYDATLPVNITRFAAQVSGCNARLTWKAEQEEKMSHYEIETSVNGREFSFSGRVLSLNEPGRIYHFDLMQQKGTQYYRLKAVEAEGTFDYSRILAVSVKCAETPSITLFPNPAASELNIKGGSEGQYIRLVDVSGASSLKQEISGSEMKIDVGHYPPGIYNAMIFSKSGNPLVTLKFAIQ